MQTNPYLTALGGRDPREWIVATPTRIKSILEKLSAEQIEAVPGPGRWSIRELICHWADAEIAWAWRLRKTMEEPHHVIQPWDQTPWATAYGAYSLRQALSTFESLRAWNLAFIGTLRNEDLSKPVTHPEWGAWTLGTVLQMMAGHDLHHLTKLEERTGISSK